MEGHDRARATEATGILLQVHTFRFLLSLIIFWRILSCTKSLSDQLQSTRTDLAKAADLVLATTESLKEFRSDSAWEHLFKYVNDVAALHNITVTVPRPQPQRYMPRRLEDGVVLDTTGSRDMLGSEHFKVSVYFPILDAFLSELQHRFTNKNLTHMRAIQSCSPKSLNFLEPNNLLPLADSYGLDMTSLSMECSLAKRTLRGKDFDCISEVLLEVTPLRAAFPTLVKLLQIALTIVVSTAKCERSFSALKRIKNYLRSTMTEQCLDDLGILSVEKDLSQKLSLDNVIDKFASHDKNRIILS